MFVDIVGCGICRRAMQTLYNSVLSKYIMKIFKNTKTKKPKKPAIENYKISYLDKRSKRYHSIVMTGFLIMFGLLGAVYLNNSRAATGVGDFNKDGKVDIFDVSTLLSKWDTRGATEYDLNSDNNVNIFDLSLLLSNWGSTTIDKKFSIVVVPDVQQENAYNPSLFSSRMQWIVDNKTSRDIRFVIQVGDLVDGDNCGTESIVYVNGLPQCSTALRSQYVYYPLPGKTDHYQFVNADNGLKILDSANIPYALAVGNHDTPAVCGGPACVGNAKATQWGIPSNVTTSQLLRQTSSQNVYFPPTRFKAPDKGFFEAGKSDNMYQTFNAGGVDWLVLSLELWPRTEAINWAKTVVQAHPSHNVIINTHSYVSDNSGAIYGSNGGYGANSPQYLFDNLVKQYANIKFVFSGHTGTTAHRTDTGVNGNVIHSFLDCYHDSNNNQTRMFEIDTENKTVETSVINNTSAPNTIRTDGKYSLTNLQFVK